MKRASSFSTSMLSKHPVFSQFSQLSQTLNGDDKKPYIYFVVPPEKSEEDCAKLNLGEMFKKAEAHSLNIMWVRDEQCMEEELHEDGNVFIFDPFGSPGFHHMLTKLSGHPRVEILSPTVLRHVFNDPQKATFETKDCPIYTLAMKDMVISLSGFNRDTKEELEILIRWMNGIISSSLTKAVTHVVTACAYTPKTIEAFKISVPVLTEHWVRQVWKDNQSVPVAASDKSYVRYICPIFYNVNVCMSQITPMKKTKMKSGIEKHGGKCLSELVRKESHILVVPNPSGDKYKFAKKWNLKCVTPEWVEDSLEKAKLLSPDDYLVGATPCGVPQFDNDRPITSTPAHSIMPDWNMTRCSAIIDDESRLIVEASNANLTRTHLESYEETVNQLRAAAGNGGYLDGCKVYLVEYEKCDELKRELNKSGAVRMNTLCEGVTHVIVSGPKLSKSISDKLGELVSTPHLVTIEWVLQSAKEGTPADEELYKFEHINTNFQDVFVAPAPPPNINLSSHIGRVSASAFEHHEPSISVNLTAGKNSGSVAATTSVSIQKTSGSGSRTTGSNTTSASNSKTDNKDTSVESKSNNASEVTSEEDTTQADDDDSVNNLDEADECSPGLFEGFKFNVVISDEEEKKYVEDAIKENGGRLVKKDADVSILPPVCSPIDRDRAGKACTKYWLFECLEHGVLDIHNCFYHIPMPTFPGMEEVMRGVVVSLSQYQNPEREYIVEIVTALGARFQEAFARKANGKILRSTHLVCKNPDTDKAKAAKKWNVPVVVAEWVVESYQNQKRLEEDKYDPAQMSVADERTVYMPTPQRRRTMQNNANNNNNVSHRSVYPPSTQKQGPSTLFNKDKRNVSPDTVKTKQKEKTPPPPADPQPSTSKSTKTGHSKEGIHTTTSLSRKAPVTNHTESEKKADQPTDQVVNIGDQSEEDNVLKRLPKILSQEEIDAEMARLKESFPYTDDSFEQKLDDLKARGINLDDVSPFTSFEERRLCDPNPDSPLLLGLPRQESRALREQFEIALNRPSNIQRIKIKTPPSTPLSEMIRKFNAKNDGKPDFDSPCASPRIASTPKNDLRRRATMNRISQGNVNISLNRDETDDDDDQPVDFLAGIRKLGSKRPSDGSPEEEPKHSKRAKKSSDEESDIDEMIPPKNKSPNENNKPKIMKSNEVDNEKPSTSKKTNRMQLLTNLIAETQSNPNKGASGGSPIKRRSGDLVPCEEVHEEIERPHLSWVDNDDDQNKMSTVKKTTAKPRILTEVLPEPPKSEPEQKKPEQETRKRSSRLKKAGSVVGVVEESSTGGTRATRQTRTRSHSRSKEDGVPLGHQPIKLSEGKRSKKKKSACLPVQLPDTPIFCLSSLDPREKTEACKAISALGGSVSKLTYFDLNCHAIVTSKLLRSEKVLGCIASGKYVIKPEYLSKSLEAGYFLPIDEGFLWHESNINEERERELARASYGWLKLQMEDNDRRPMAGYNFFLLDQAPEKVNAFERLIAAGGGEVVKDIKLANCVLKDEKSTAAVPKGLRVENPLYLNTLILKLPEAS